MSDYSKSEYNNVDMQRLARVYAQGIVDGMAFAAAFPSRRGLALYVRYPLLQAWQISQRRLPMRGLGEQRAYCVGWLCGYA